MSSRIDRVLDKMKEKGLTQLMVTDPKSIWYLTGVHVEPIERFWGLLLKENGNHVLFANYLFYIPEVPYEEVWFTDMDDLIGMIAEKVDPNAVLGIDKVMVANFLIPLQERCPNMGTVLGSDCVDDCRAMKDENEIAIMIKASEIADAVIERAFDYVKEGMTEKQVADFIDAEFIKEGATGPSFPTIVCFGANAADQHHEPDDTVLHAGENILIDMGCLYKRYCSDMTRTNYCKSVDPEQAKIHDIVREATEAAEAIIKPGVRFCDINQQARDIIDGAGYGEYWKIRLGHFIGQTDHEKGDVSSTNTAVAKPGMIFSIEPGIYIPGKCGVRIEDLILVTEDGYINLNKVDKHYRIID